MLLCTRSARIKLVIYQLFHVQPHAVAMEVVVTVLDGAVRQWCTNSVSTVTTGG
jgi:hypothetical protein